MFSNSDKETSPRKRDAGAQRKGVVQTKIKVGDPNDKYEHEADAMADKVMSMPAPKISPSGAVQRFGGLRGRHLSIQQKCTACQQEEAQTKPLASLITPLVQRQSFEEEDAVQSKSIQRMPIEEEEPIQSKRIQRMEDDKELATKPIQRMSAEEEEPMTKRIQRMPPEEEEPLQGKSIQRKTNGSKEVGSSLESQLNASKGGGNPLPAETNEFMSSRFGTDFSGVKVHTDSNAVQMNKELNSQAFAHGNHIYFNQGRYDTNSSSGKHLLAHELTHTVQQGGGLKEKKYRVTPRKSKIMKKGSGLSFRLPMSKRSELIRVTGDRIVTCSSYFRTALLEVKVKVANMLKAQKEAASIILEIALGFLMPGIGKLLGKGLAAFAKLLPVSASTTQYRLALALLDDKRTKSLFLKATETGRKLASINAQNQLSSITGDSKYEAFFEVLKKSAAQGFDKLNNNLSIKNNRELGILFLAFDPTKEQYGKLIEVLVFKFQNEIKPIGEKTDDGRYGTIKARWIEGANRKVLALTGEGRFYNVGSGPRYYRLISSEMKTLALQATKSINYNKIPTIKWTGLEKGSAPSDLGKELDANKISDENWRRKYVIVEYN
ncbi:eCIS core domain-containing protein [Ekhidna sp.]